MKNESRKSEHQKSLDERWARHPHMYERLQRITDQMEQAIAKGITADEAEAMAIKQINELGRALLTDWAKVRQERSVEEVRRERPEAKRDAKKLNWQTTFGVVELEEQILRLGWRGVRLRPFCLQARVKPGGHSRALERALSNFGAEESFGRAARVKDHYGIDVSSTAIRRVTYAHARRMQQVEIGPIAPFFLKGIPARHEALFSQSPVPSEISLPGKS